MSSALVPHLDAAQIAGTLERAGLAICGTLPEDHVNRVAELCGPVRHFAVDNPHEKWDVVKQIAYDPKFQDIARNYFGAEPIVRASSVWWSVPGSKAQDGLTPKGHISTFHFDVPDCKSLILFVYLTDVPDQEHGAHMVIEGTHKRKTFADLMKVYLDDDVAERKYGNRIKTVLGRKGTFFFEEQTAYHRGAEAEKPRLMLGITYTLCRKSSKSPG